MLWTQAVKFNVVDVIELGVEINVTNRWRMFCASDKFCLIYWFSLHNNACWDLFGVEPNTKILLAYTYSFKATSILRYKYLEITCIIYLHCGIRIINYDSTAVR